MKFETMNWENEANRIREAFGIDEQLEFEGDALYKRRSLKLTDGGNDDPIIIYTPDYNLQLHVTYYENYGSFFITHVNEYFEYIGESCVDMGIGWKGRIHTPPEWWIRVVPPEFIKGLSNLGLYTEHVARALAAVTYSPSSS